MPLDLPAIKSKIADLQNAINTSIPGYAGVLNLIHKELQAQPELIYKLDDTEIASLISGLEKFHKVEVVDVKEKKPVSKKQGSLLSADDV